VLKRKEKTARNRSGHNRGVDTGDEEMRKSRVSLLFGDLWSRGGVLRKLIDGER
jgi:hypothetical protein